MKASTLLLLLIGICLPKIVFSQASMTAPEVVQPTCGDLTDGSITVTGSGAVDISFSINGVGQPSGTFPSLGNGTYVIQMIVHDTISCSGCTATIALNTAERPVPGEAVPTMPTNFCKSDGMVAIPITGGADPQINFNGMGFGTATTFENLMQEVPYGYEVQNGDGTCVTTGFSVALEGLPAVVVISAEFIKPTDCMADDGKIMIVANEDPMHPLEYSIGVDGEWQTDPVFTGLKPDFYTVEARHAGLEGDAACPSNMIMDSIVTRKAPTIDSIRLTDPTDWCTKDGMIQIYGSGGEEDPTYQYSIDGGSTWATEFEFLDLVEGEFPIQMANYDTSCVQDSGIYIMVEPIMPNLLGINTIDPSDCHASDGKIILLFEDQDGDPYAYSIQDSSYSVMNPYPPITDEVLADPLSYNTLINMEQGPVKYWTDEDRELDFAESGSGVLAVEFYGLPQGTYEISYRRDTNVCITAHSEVDLVDPPMPSISVSQDPPINCKRQTGSISISGSGGRAPHEFTIDGGANWLSTGGTFPDLPAGSYSPIVRNVDGTCPNGSGTIVFPLYPLEPTLTNVDFTHPTDCGAADGTISITATPGTSSPQYSIGGGWQTSPDFTGLVQGAYTPMVRNSDGGTCAVGTSIIQLMDPPNPSFPSIASASPDNGCNQSGSITINSTGGRSPIQYSLDGGVTYQTSPTFTNINNDTYTIYVKNTDATCIMGPLTYTLTGPVLPIVTSVQVIDPSDCNLSNGEIRVFAQGGATFEYSFDGGTTFGLSSVKSGLDESDGIQQVQVRNQGGGCHTVDAGKYRVTDHISPVLGNQPIGIIINHINACGLTNGRIEIPVLSGDKDRVFFPQGSFAASTSNAAAVSTYQFSIDNGTTWQPSGIFTDLVANTYQPIFRNSNGTCAVSEPSITITTPNPPTAITTKTSANCEASDGKIKLEITDGLGQFQARIAETGESFTSPSLTPPHVFTFSNLKNQEPYTLIYESAAGNCTVSQTVTLDGGAKPKNITVEVKRADCFTEEGSITVSATSDSHPVQYRLNGGSWQSSGVFNNLIAGSYRVEVSNNDGSCLVDAGTHEVVQISKLQVTVPNFRSPTDCGKKNGVIGIWVDDADNETYETSIDGGLTWNIVKFIYINLDEGVYNIRARYPDGECEIIYGDVTLSDPAAPEINYVYRQAPANCMNNGTIIISPVTNSGFGTYEFSIDNGATWGTDNEFLAVEGGTHYPSIRNKDATNTCKVDAAPITFAAASIPPTISNVSQTDPTSCMNNDGTITVTASEGIAPLEYSKDGGSTWQTSNVFTALAGGNYAIQVASAGQQCPIDYGMVTLTSPPIVTMMHTVQQPVICVSERGSISMTASGGSGNYSYSIDGGTTVTSTATFPNLLPGTYNIQVIDVSFFCTASATVMLNAVPAMPSLSPTTSNHSTDCNANDGTISINATGGTGTLQYRINPTGTWTTNPNFINLAAGTYTIQVSNNDLSCPQTGETITLADPPAPIFTSATPTQATECTYEKGQITLAATGGINFLRYSIDGGITWQIDDPVFTDLEAGVYQPRVRNSNETCIQSLPDVTINAVTPPILYTGYRSKSPLCVADGEIHVNASMGSGNLEYSIDDGATWQIDSFFTGLTVGTYTIKVGDRGSICEAAGSTLTLTDACVCPDISVTTSDLTSCTAEDGIIQIRSISNAPQFEIEYSLNGRDWGHQDKFENLVPNITYTPSIRYANGACVVQREVIFIRPEVPTLNTPTFSHPTCEASDGQITINTTGGTSELEFSINGGQNWQRSATFTGLGEGRYQLTAQNLADNCSAAITEVFLDMPSQPIIDEVLIDPVSDCGLEDGRIELVITNADRSLEYSYRTQNGIPQWENDHIFEHLKAHSARVRVRNIDGTCATDAYADLARVEGPIAPIVQRVFITQHPSDCGISDGELFIQAAGGSSDLEYRVAGQTWQSSATIEALPAGIFQVQVRNRVGGTCVVDYRETVTLIEPMRPALGSLRAYTECGTPLGTIEVRATNGETPGDYQYTLDDLTNWSASGNLPGDAGSTHAVYIANGDRTCKTLVGNITIPDLRNVTFTLGDIAIMPATSCSEPSGMVIINGMGRSSRAHTVSTEYEFRIDDNPWESNFDILSVSTGNHTIEARTIRGVSCQSNPLSFAIAAPTVPELTSDNRAASDCGVADGILNLNVAVSGAVEYTINGTNEGSQSYFENKAAGDYTVAYRISSTGCTSTEVVTVPGPISPVYQNKTVSQPSDCSTTNNGQITIAAQAGSANLQYRLGTGQWQNSPTFPDLGNGSYPIQIRNQDGTCVVEPETVNLQRNNEPLTNVSFTSTEAACGFATGQITLSATGGNDDLEYSIGGEFQSSPNFSKLASRIYTVRVQNGNGTCQISEPVMVGNNPAPPIEPTDVKVQDISCNATGRIEIPIASPSEYEFTIDGGATWQNQNIFDGLAASTNYNVGVRNGDDSCEKELGRFTINSVDAPTLSAFQATPADAGGVNGQIEINIEFGITPYTISLFRNDVMVDGTIRQNDEDFVLSGFAAGTYEVELVDGNGCRVIDPVTIESTRTEPLMIECVQQEDTEGCEFINIAIGFNGAIPPVEITYNDGIPFVAEKNVLKNPPLGIYTFTIIDATGTEASCTTEILPATGPDVTISVSDACGAEGGKIEAKIKANALSSGPYTFEWSNGQTTTHDCQDIIENLPAGDYNLIITAADGCQVIENQINIKNILPQISRVGNENCVCVGQSNGNLTIEVDMSYETIEWTGPAGNYTTEDLIDIPAGDYTVTVTTEGNCEATASFTLEECIPITINGTVEDAIDGEANGSITLNEPIGDNFTYQWNTGATTNAITDLAMGTYMLTVMDENACSATQSFLVGDMNNPSTPFMVSCEKIEIDECSPYKFSIDISGGVPDEQGNYQLTINGPVSESKMVTVGTYADFEAIEIGTYTIEVRDVNETKTITKEIENENGEDINIEVTNASCATAENGMIELKIKRYATVKGPYTIEWIDQMPPSAGCTSVLSDLPAGEYCVEVAGADGCMAMTCVMVEAKEDIEVMIEEPTSCLCQGETLTLNTTVSGGTEPYTYTWSPALIGANPTINMEGPYSLMVMDSEGCVAMADPVSVTSCGPAMNLQVIDSDGGCLGQMDGYINLELNGGAPPFTFNLVRGFGPMGEVVAPSLYSFSNLAPSLYSFSNLAPSLYWVVVEDANNCGTNIFQPLFSSTIIDVSTSIENQDCEGLSSWINANASGGLEPYTYELRTRYSEPGIISSNSIFENVLAGNYIIVATDVNGCEGFTRIIVDPIPLRFKTRFPFSINITNPMGCNDTNGSIEFNGTPEAEGGIPPYTFFWEESSTRRELANTTSLSAGRYCMKVRDSQGCEDEGPCRELVEEVLPEEMITVVDSFIKDECEGEFNGRIRIQVVSNDDVGAPNFSFQWNLPNGNVNSLGGTSTLDGIRTGNYRVTITDLYTNCSIVKRFFVDELISMGEFVIIEDNNNFKPTCPFQPTGGATIGLEGGNFPYTVTVKKGDEIIQEDKKYNNSPVVIENLTAGEYTFEATDICDRVLPNILSFSIGEIPEMNFQVTQNIKNCPGESFIEYNITGGAPPYTYRWNNGVEGSSDVGITQRLDGLSDANYSITIMDNSGCFQDWSVNVDAYAPARPRFENRLVSCPYYINEIELMYPDRDVNTLIPLLEAGIIGEINITGFEGTEGDTYLGPVNIIWLPELDIPDNRRTVSGLLPGNYAITITDGCNNFERGNERICSIDIVEGNVVLDGLEYPESCFDLVRCVGSGRDCEDNTGYQEIPINTIWSGYDLSNVSVDGNDDCSVELLCNNGNSPDSFFANSRSLGFRAECNDNGCKEDLECRIAINRDYTARFADITGQDWVNDFTVIVPTIIEETTITRDFEVINPGTPKLMGGFCNPWEVEVNLSCGNIQDTGCTECLDCDTNNPLEVKFTQSNCEDEGCGCEVIFDCEGIDGKVDGTIVTEFVRTGTLNCTDICESGRFCKQVTKCRTSNLGDFTLKESLVTRLTLTGTNCQPSGVDTISPTSCIINYRCPGDGTETPFIHSFCLEDCEDGQLTIGLAPFQCKAENVPFDCFVTLPPVSKRIKIIGDFIEKDIEIEILQDNKFRVTKVFPNPFDSRINIEIYASYSGKQQIQLFDVLGRKVQYLEKQMERGKNLINLEITSNLKHGIYYLYIVDEFGNKYSTSVVHSPN